LFGYVHENLQHILRNIVKSYPPEEQEKILQGQKNLLAVIIDTNWYNGFSDIMGVWDEKNKHKNIYCMIANSNNNVNTIDLPINYQKELPLTFDPGE
jgi:hypothetical protein